MKAFLKTALLAQAPWLLAAACADGLNSSDVGDCSAVDELSALQIHVMDHEHTQKDIVLSHSFPNGMPSTETMAHCKATEDAKERPELVEPPVLERLPAPEGVARFEMTMQECLLPTPWVGGEFITRGYSGNGVSCSVPGPTIRIKPGEVLEVKFKNALGAPPGDDNCDINQAHLGLSQNPSMICKLQCTNWHTHGLHVSGEGAADNIAIEIRPGGEHTFRIPLPANHMPGTHLYHPHLHHATASQAGGGAHGAIIVEDPADYLPAQVADMKEKTWVMSLVHIAKMIRLESWGISKGGGDSSHQHFWRNTLYTDWRWDPAVNLEEEDSTTLPPQLVVNGQYNPCMTMVEGEWIRVRMIFASIEMRTEIWVDGGSQAMCDWQLISKDGVYLHSAPRSIQRVHLASGSRADVALSCKCHNNQETCDAKVKFEALWQPLGNAMHVTTMADTIGTALTLRVQRPAGSSNPPNVQPIPSFSVRRPCYLVDLRNAHPDYVHTLEFPQVYPLILKLDRHGHVWAHDKPSPLADIPCGKIQEWDISGMMFHPFHIHINPFQIISASGDTYYLPGDWHDSLQTTGTDHVTVRSFPQHFTGTMIAHCHILEHEDNGMMAWFRLTGHEGCTATEVARMLDPHCYEGLFEDA